MTDKGEGTIIVPEPCRLPGSKGRLVPTTVSWSIFADIGACRFGSSVRPVLVWRCVTDGNDPRRSSSSGRASQVPVPAI